MHPRVAILAKDPAAGFPPATQALSEPDGLLAAGGDLSPARLLDAYRHGIFPWYERDQPILWWSPARRLVFRTDGVHLSRRFRRTLRTSSWTVRADTSFDAVVAACAAIRPGQRGTWITAEMRAAYGELHRLGHAHSIEVFDRERLVGGLYGVAIGRMFYAESMFSGDSGGSKVALRALASWIDRLGAPMFDAQLENPHLRRMGGELMPRDRFLAEVARLTALPGLPGSWEAAFGGLEAAALAG